MNKPSFFFHFEFPVFSAVEVEAVCCVLVLGDMDVLGCPFYGCNKAFDNSKSLYNHAQCHLFGMTCRTCGRSFRSMPSWQAHFRDDEGCRVNKRRRPLPMQQASPPVVVDEAVFLVDERPEGRPVWKPFETSSNGGAPPVVPLDPRGFDEEELDRLVADVVEAQTESLMERVVGDDELEREFVDWFGRVYSLGKVGGSEPNSHGGGILGSLAHDVIEKYQLSANAIRALHLWVERDVAPLLNVKVESFAAFQDRLHQRNSLVVATTICTNPPLTFFHIPALYACDKIVADETLVCGFEERVEINPRTKIEERTFRHWWDGEKMREISVGDVKTFLAFSAFIDDTSVIEYRGRSVTPFMLVPQNIKDGQFDVVGFVPHLSDEAALVAGIKKQHIPLFRCMILQKCISVVLLFGLMDSKSPAYLAQRTGEFVSVRNILVSLRVDHKARLESLALVPLSKASDKRNPACRRHEIAASRLNRVVEDCDDLSYCHNKTYRALWLKLLANLQSVDTKKSAALRLVQLGQRPIRPALFAAYLFDGGVDSPEDIHHVGPLGIGLFLLSKLPQVLKLVFPNTLVEGHAKKNFFPDTVVGGPFLPLDKGDSVSWNFDEVVHVKDLHVWATDSNEIVGLCLSLAL